MRILLLGRNGQLGWELERLLAGTHEVVSTDRSEVDLAQADQIRKAVQAARPEVIVNAAAYTNVEQAERQADLAYAVNGMAPGVLAEEAKRIGAAFIHYSTDYVFDGDVGSPYTEEDRPSPINVYGSSKLEGERNIRQADGACFIFRTSWVYSLRKDSFVTKFLGWARRNPQVRVVTDQTASPTWCRALADATIRLLSMMGADPAGWTRERKGVYHLAGGGYVNRFDMVHKILEFLPKDYPLSVRDIQPARTSDFHDAARRPVFSALDTSRFTRTFGIELPHWEASLRLALADYFQSNPTFS